VTFDVTGFSKTTSSRSGEDPDVSRGQNQSACQWGELNCHPYLQEYADLKSDYAATACVVYTNCDKTMHVYNTAAKVRLILVFGAIKHGGILMCYTSDMRPLLLKSTFVRFHP
jgi:hypothetical protein